MDEASALAPRSLDVAALRREVAAATAALNAGDPEPLLARYVEEVVVVSPLGAEEDSATDFVLHGKAAYRHFLLAFLDDHVGYEMTDLLLDEAGRVVVSILTRSGERRRLVVTLDELGRGTRVVVFAEG